MTKYIIGIDEVGRGALAGPVTVAAFLLPRNFQFPRPTSLKDEVFGGRAISNFQINSNFQNSKISLKNRKLRLKDSKKLSPKQREIWFSRIKESQKLKVKNQRLYYAVANASPRIIDKINISKAANLAATSALKALIAKLHNCKISRKKSFNPAILKSCNIFLDGGLHLVERDKYKVVSPKVKTIIKGDEKISAISLASIIAKVHRDKLMKKLHKKYPRYDFINNVGYGTKKHIKAIKKHGRSKIHRKSFKVKN